MSIRVLTSGDKTFIFPFFMIMLRNLFDYNEYAIAIIKNIKINTFFM